MINILVVIPYPGIGENYEKAIGRIRVKEVNFSTTYAYGTGKKVIDQIKGYDIVVVRGMTYLAVRNACPDVHVVEIPMSNTDILDALYQIKKKMGLVKVGKVCRVINCVLIENKYCLKLSSRVNPFNVSKQFTQ